MRGNVIGFDPDTNSGAIGGHDGQRYDFVASDWRGQNQPTHGDPVDFLPAAGRARQICPIEPEYVSPGLGRFLFSVRGRVSRSQFWLKWFLPVLATHLVLGIVTAGAAVSLNFTAAIAFAVIWVGFVLATLWPSVAVLVKRIHDRNKTGWLVLAYYIPAALHLLMIAAGSGGNPITLTLSMITAGVTIWFFVEFGCLRGTFGVNRYGPDPVPH